MAQDARLIRTLLGRLLLAGLVGLAAFTLLLAEDLLPVPARLNPFMPLDVADEPNWLTRYKLSRLERNGRQCVGALRSSRSSFSQVPDERTGEGCGFTNAVEMERVSVDFSSPFRASCPLAVSWAMFERHILQQAARRHLGQEVVRVEHFGTYACRNLYHREGGRRSEHATANAIDVAAFMLADGRKITVLSDWDGEPDKAAFLRALRDGACRFFDVVLSPAYNEAHRDHFHFDKGDRAACR